MICYIVVLNSLPSAGSVGAQTALGFGKPITRLSRRLFLAFFFLLGFVLAHHDLLLTVSFCFFLGLHFRPLLSRRCFSAHVCLLSATDTNEYYIISFFVFKNTYYIYIYSYNYAIL